MNMLFLTDLNSISGRTVSTTEITFKYIGRCTKEPENFQFLRKSKN